MFVPFEPPSRQPAEPPLLSCVSPRRQSTELPSFRVTELPSYRAIELPSCRVTEPPNHRTTEPPSYRVAELPSPEPPCRRAAVPPCRRVSELLSCRVIPCHRNLFHCAFVHRVAIAMLSFRQMMEGTSVGTDRASTKTERRTRLVVSRGLCRPLLERSIQSGLFNRVLR